MNTINKFFFLFIMMTGLIVTGCVDNDFDEPENTFTILEEDIIPISEVLSFLNGTQGVVLGEGNIGTDTKYIKATITADDASGNFFKTIVFQDATGALSIIPDRNELNAEFPAGNEVFIKLNGLTLTLDANLPRLGYSLIDDRLQRIPDILVNDFCIPGGVGEVIEPTPATISDILQNSTEYLNKVIALEDVEFTVNWVGRTFADADNPDGPQTINTDIEDCDDNTIILRNSGFADFATETIPLEKGRLLAVASVFRDDLQLFIRDLSDIQFTKERCDGSGGQATNELEISDIKSSYYDLGVDEAPEGFISGTVISDQNNPSYAGQNIVVQNGDHGIVVRFTDFHNLQVGDQVKITVTGQEVSEFNELLQVNNVPTFNAIVTGNGALPTPKEATISQITGSIRDYLSTRVIIKDAELNGSTYGSGVDINDGTGSIQLWTRNTASFADEAVPSGKVEVSAVVGQFNSPQVIINDLDDITGGTVDPGGNGGDEMVDANFEEGEDFDPVDLEGWLNIATKGTRQWYKRSFDDNGFAECEAYEDENPETEAWLITPIFDTDEKSVFSFQSAQAFWQHQGLSVWVSPEFSDLANANWIEVDQARIANDGDEQYEMIDSGEVDLTDYLGGKVRVGFKYEGTASSNTTKMRIDNITLK